MKTLTKAAITLSAAGLAYLRYQNKNEPKTAETPAAINGFAKEGFEAVREFYDEVMKDEVKFSLGFMKSSPNFLFGRADFVRRARSGRFTRIRRS